MDGLEKVRVKEISTELFKNVNVKISLEGWPCTVAVIGLGITYVLALKIKYDAQNLKLENRSVTQFEKNVA